MIAAVGIPVDFELMNPMKDTVPTYHPAPRGPKFRLPPGACDSHVHVFGPTERFAYAADARFRPADAPKERLFALHDAIGIERCVIVQSGCHGFDNAVVADAIAARPGRYKGVALCPADVDEETLARLAELGFCGVRFNYMAHLAGGTPIQEVAALARRLQRYGMHLQIHLDSRLIETMAPALAAMPVPVVIDHMARVEVGSEHAPRSFEVLLRLLEQPHLWVKVSALERASRIDAPWTDALPYAKALVQEHPAKVLWGTDWPHPNFRAAPPDDGDIVDMIPMFATTANAQQALLVDNPARLYRFKD
ncbi:MAG: amidohydrolase family protein [Quisquiliibacterium sp.]